jgi:hypothetical protein
VVIFLNYLESEFVVDYRARAHHITTEMNEACMINNIETTRIHVTVFMINIKT